MQEEKQSVRLVLMAYGLIALTFGILLYFVNREDKEMRAQEEAEKKRRDDELNREYEEWENAPRETVWCVRHAEDNYRGGNRDQLTEVGILQASVTAELLKAVLEDKPTLVLTSPALRCRLTADIICGSLVTEWPEVREWLDGGEGLKTMQLLIAMEIRLHPDMAVVVVAHDAQVGLLSGKTDPVENAEILEAQIVML